MFIIDFCFFFRQNPEIQTNHGKKSEDDKTLQTYMHNLNRILEHNSNFCIFQAIKSIVILLFTT